MSVQNFAECIHVFNLLYIYNYISNNYRCQFQTDYKLCSLFSKKKHRSIVIITMKQEKNPHFANSKIVYVYKTFFMDLCDFQFF